MDDLAERLSKATGLLDQMNALARPMGGEVVIVNDVEDHPRWYEVRKDGKTCYTSPSAEQMFAWLEVRAKFGIGLEQERRPSKRKDRYAR